MTQNTNRQVYLEKGFVSLPGFFDVHEITTCLEKIREFIESLVPQLPRDHVFYEDRETLSTLKQIQQMQDHCPWCNEFMNGKPRTLAEDLMG
ncbi:MAG: phytanoyl-CoA dioxygenase family protein, partial [Verrucomicrobiota bacterium]|nr:phytanoyl-CoA dioxygenase family protein [Verrucomicrobiota bacterium]